MIQNLLSIPFTDLSIIIILAALLFLFVYLYSIWKKKLSQKHQTIKKFTIKYFLRIFGFTILSILFIGGGMMLSNAYRTVIRTTAPAPFIVTVPDNLGFQVEEVTFLTHDGFTISGWFVPPENGATVLLLHGYGGTRKHMIFHAKALVEGGFGILMYDERASGQSEGDYRSYGWMDPPDVDSALNYLNSRSEVDPKNIGIGGCSIGGQISLQAASRNSQIQAVWADGPSGIVASDYGPPTNWATAISWLSNRLLDHMLLQFLDIEKPEPMTTIIASIGPRPIMLVAGGKERSYFGAESHHVTRFYHAAGENTQLWVIPEATHCDGPRQRPEEYKQRLIGFFTKWLKPY